MAQIRLFGGVSAATDSGEAVDVGPPKCQAVLAALALSAGSTIPVWRIVELVWGSEAPRTANKTLQSYVTRLRKGLGPDSIVRVGTAYHLDVDRESVDILRFQQLLDSGDREAALAEWVATPLAGLDSEGLAPVVDGLVEQWLGAVEADLDHRLQQEPAAVIGTLTELTANYPFREGLWALLMTALYHVGRQADALAAYRRAREHIVEHLGSEPGLRLRELESSILKHDEQLEADRPPAGRPSGLPTGTVTFAFSDVEGSTRLWSTRRRAMAAAMARHDELVRASVQQQGGFVFATGGDSFGVAFDRAGDAASWARELQNAIYREPWPGELQMRVRVGIHTGEAEERGNDYFGPAVNIAARMAAAGHGGQTLASEVTAALLDATDQSDLGAFRLDGVVTDQRIFQLDHGEHPPLRTEDGRRGNLPRRSGRLIGREQSLELIGSTLEAAPIVTLVGPGGIGKTQLALAAAKISEADFPDGAWLVELAEIATSTDVPRAVAESLHVKERPGRTLTQSIAAALESRRALLVLDNCEHIVNGSAELAQALAGHCPDVRVLATSREGLGVRDEQLVTVPPLEPAGAGLELFCERASAVAPTFDRDDSRSDVEEICRRLDGVPLAIELAAARSGSLTPADLVERLEDRLGVLTGGWRTSVERHQTLRATIQWSYDLLEPSEQALFERLSAFAGPFDLAAAQTVATHAGLTGSALEPPGEAADFDELLGGLVDRSMLIVKSGPFGRRFRLLETMRQFGAELLSESGQADIVAARHAEWCLEEVVEIHELLTGTAEAEGVIRLREEWSNLRGAFDWAIARRDCHLAHALVSPVATEIALRNQTEIGDWVERILAIAPPDDEELIAFGLSWAAFRYMQNRDSEAFERVVDRHGEPEHPLVRHARAFSYYLNEELVECAPSAVAELRRTGEDHAAELVEISSLVGSLLFLGRFEEHDRLMTAKAERYRATGPPTFLHWALFMLGCSASVQGRHGKADQFFEQSAAVKVPERTIPLGRPIEARIALRRGDPSGAFQMLRSHVNELLETDSLVLTGLACAEFVNMMVAIEALPEAARVLGYLEASGTSSELASRAFVAPAARKIVAGGGMTSDQDLADGRDLEPRQALAYIRDVLGGLIADGQGSDAINH